VLNEAKIEEKIFVGREKGQKIEMTEWKKLELKITFLTKVWSYSKIERMML
jgi:hypothetical protein